MIRLEQVSLCLEIVVVVDVVVVVFVEVSIAVGSICFFPSPDATWGHVAKITRNVEIQYIEKKHLKIRPQRIQKRRARALAPA